VRRAVLALLAGAAVCAWPAAAQVAPPDVAALGTPHSVAVGKPWDGRLENGVQLPEEGPDFVTGRYMDIDTSPPNVIADAIADQIDREAHYEPVETDGARRAAALIAELL
jgi:hypothetical protein